MIIKKDSEIVKAKGERKSSCFKCLRKNPSDESVRTSEVKTKNIHGICLGVDLEPDEWIKDSGCSKHMTGNRKLFSSYKAYNEVILIGSIPVEVPVAPEVGAAAVASPAGVLELDTHSSSEVDPSESSPPPVSVAPMVSPFLCSDDSESDTKIPERYVSPTTYTLRIPTALILPAPSAIVAPSSEYPLAPVVAPLRIYIGAR
ncbi:hypothetical protein Tco_0954085 [Tanacetum coccineum]|uniref:Retrovirus-related Pol polyprotein from transposon TNT 1-94-like beta-barrel domain-containing protein n=1 Tax=Tanacetum coccineum TaxID=301880 RepID=A0ABQ5E1P3_9ASTR